MSEEHNDVLLETREKVRIKQKLESAVLETRKSLAAERARLAQLGAVLKKEEADVRKLEGLSLTAMFHQFLGSKEDRLDKERQEVFSAKLRFDQCAHEVASLERDIADMEARLAALGDPEAEYARALERKAARIEGAARADLVQLTEKAADINSDIKEIGEAVAAGGEVIAGLDRVIASFKSAGNWGIVDLIGGGIIITAVKHSKIDKAKAAIHEVQSRLGRFRRELADLRTRPDVPLSVEISSFEKFADYLFDGLIFDWIVQSKINKSLDAAVEMRAKMASIVADLRRRLEDRRKDRDDTMGAKRGLVEEA
jgi:chromosome segregation ATPase